MKLVKLASCFKDLNHKMILRKASVTSQTHLQHFARQKKTDNLTPDLLKRGKRSYFPLF